MSEENDYNIDLQKAKELINENGILVWVHAMEIDLGRMAEILEVDESKIRRVNPNKIIAGKYPEEILSYKNNVLVCRSGHTSAAMLDFLKESNVKTPLYNLRGGLLSIVSDDYLKTIMHW